MDLINASERPKMNQEIIDKYKISFENKILSSKLSGNIVYKNIKINNNVIDEFLVDWSDPEEIDELLIPDIKAVMNGDNSLIENGSETISIDIEPVYVTFYKKEIGEATYPKIPTIDFLEIIEAWRDFLLQAPLNGSSA